MVSDSHPADQDHSVAVFSQAVRLAGLTHILLLAAFSSSPFLLSLVASVTDGEDAEVVSMKILEILLECLRCSAGEFLTDQAVTDMVTECFHVRSQQHSSKLLRRYAENVLMQMVLVLFARIRSGAHTAGARFTRGS